MPWKKITDAEVLEEFTPQEQTAITAIQGGDKLSGVVKRVTESWRGTILMGGNQLGASGTLPESVREDAVSEMRWRWLISLPSLKSLQTKARETAYDDARELKKEIRQGKTKTEVPEDPIESEQSATMPSVETRTRRFDHCDEEGA